MTFHDKFILKNGKTVELKECDPSQAKSFLLFASQMAKETTNTTHYASRVILEEDVRKKWKEALDSPFHFYVGAYDGEKLIGQFTMRKSNPGHPWLQHLGEFGIGILQEYCSRGLGSHMMKVMEEQAREMKITKLEAKVRTDNEAGVKFYEKHGFHIEGTRKMAALIEGKYLDEYYIYKELTL